MNVRVAVVVPCYNDGRFVVDAVASVREQEACELVVVDDGSDDPYTLAVLDELSAQGVTVVTQPNRGLSAARMAGVAATSAPYVHPLDADDRLAPGAVARLADALDRNPASSAAWGDVCTFGGRECVIPGARRLDPWRITYLPEVIGTSLLRRSALAQTHGWDMGSGYEDWDFWMTAAERGWATEYVPGVTLLYREHPTPRMAVSSRARHGELAEQLRVRHRDLFAGRRANRRSSPTRRAVKLAWPLIERLPRIADDQRDRLLVLARDTFEPWARNQCAPSPPRRIARYLLARRRTWPPSSPKARRAR